MKNINRSTVIIAISTLAIGLILGWLIFGGTDKTSENEHIHNASEAKETIWTCSMHPQIRKNEPGCKKICKQV